MAIEHSAADIELSVGCRRNPFRVVAFNTAESWSEDVSADVAAELRRRCEQQMRELPPTISDFVYRHEMPDRRQLAFLLIKHRFAFFRQRSSGFSSFDRTRNSSRTLNETSQF